jgi:D-aspartate ligase
MTQLLPHHHTSPETKTAPVVLYGKGGLNLLRCLTDKKLLVFYLSPSANDCALYSRYSQRGRVIADVKTHPEKTIADLIAFSLQLQQEFARKPVLFYGDDAMLLLLSRQRERLAPYYDFMMPEAAVIESLVDKAIFSTLTAQHQLPVPQTVLSSQVYGAADILNRLSLPCILKPNNHVGWFESEAIEQEGGQPQKMLRANTEEELQRLYLRIHQFTDDFVVQEYIPGGDDCIYSFHAYYNRASQPLAYYVGRKIRTYPKDSGVSTYIELVKEPAVVALGLEILAKLKLVGPVKIDFKKDAVRGQYFMLEINPRFNLWNYLGTECGINLLHIAYADLAGLPLELPKDYRTGVRWLSFGDDLRGFLRSYHRAGELSWFDWLRSLRGQKIYDYFAWRDPYPFFKYILGYVQKGIGNRLTKANRVKS